MSTRSNDDHKRIWGSGYHAGLAAAKTGGTMNQARQKAMEDNLTGIAKKVFAAVPIANPWKVEQIGEEIKRQTGGAYIEIKTLTGCLNTLTEQGLIKECERRHFIRVQTKERATHVKLVKDEPIMSIPKQEQSPAPQSPDVLNVFVVQANKLRKMADDLEEAGLVISDDMSKTSAESKKLSQLKELLLSLK